MKTTLNYFFLNNQFLLLLTYDNLFYFVTMLSNKICMAIIEITDELYII